MQMDPYSSYSLLQSFGDRLLCNTLPYKHERFLEKCISRTDNPLGKNKTIIDLSALLCSAVTAVM